MLTKINVRLLVLLKEKWSLAGAIEMIKIWERNYQSLIGNRSWHTCRYNFWRSRFSSSYFLFFWRGWKLRKRKNTNKATVYVIPTTVICKERSAKPFTLVRMKRRTPHARGYGHVNMDVCFLWTKVQREKYNDIRLFVWKFACLFEAHKVLSGLNTTCERVRKDE